MLRAGLPKTGLARQNPVDIARRQDCTFLKHHRGRAHCPQRFGAPTLKSPLTSVARSSDGTLRRSASILSPRSSDGTVRPFSANCAQWFRGSAYAGARRLILRHSTRQSACTPQQIAQTGASGSVVRYRCSLLLVFAAASARQVMRKERRNFSSGPLFT